VTDAFVILDEPATHDPESILTFDIWKMDSGSFAPRASGMTNADDVIYRISATSH
jgi:hypothetical protein